jgi:hypothetical protein
MEHVLEQLLAVLPRSRESAATALDLVKLGCQVALHPLDSIFDEQQCSYAEMLDNNSPEDLMAAVPHAAMLPTVEGLLLQLKLCRAVLRLIATAAVGKGYARKAHSTS